MHRAIAGRTCDYGGKTKRAARRGRPLIRGLRETSVPRKDFADWAFRPLVIATFIAGLALPLSARAETPVPTCDAPIDLVRLVHPLTRVAHKLATNLPITIVAIGSSSTAGHLSMLFAYVFVGHGVRGPCTHTRACARCRQHASPLGFEARRRCVSAPLADDGR